MNVKMAQARVRKFLNEHHLICITLALAFVGLSIAAIAVQLSDRSNSVAPTAFYYNLSTGKLFTASPDEPPPIRVPDSPTVNAAEAFVFSCGSCADERERFVGYVVLYEPEAKKKLMEMVESNVAAGHDRALALLYATEQALSDPTIEEGHMIGRPGGDTKAKEVFYPIASAEGAAIKASPDSHCAKGQRAAVCVPGDLGKR